MEVGFKRRHLLLGVSVLAWTRRAGAHTRLVDSEPRDGSTSDAPPAIVVLRFSSGVEKRFSRLALVVGERVHPLALDAGGGLVRELRAPLPPVPAGAHVVRYDVVASDGHRVRGAVRFTVR